MYLAGTSNLGVALIGANGMARNYRDNYGALPSVGYRLVVDVDAASIQEVANLVGAERASTDWRDALADDIAVVDISTPNHLHAEQLSRFCGQASTSFCKTDGPHACRVPRNY